MLLLKNLSCKEFIKSSYLLCAGLDFSIDAANSVDMGGSGGGVRFRGLLRRGLWCEEFGERP